MKTANMTVFKSSPDQILLNAHSKLGDVLVVSQDRRYFVAHRIVLISASDLLAKVLSINCNFCREELDESSVVFFEGISGETVKSFLCLIYTGLTHGPGNQEELVKLCIDLKLKSLESIRQDVAGTHILTNASSGYEEIDSMRVDFGYKARFMTSPKTSLNRHDFIDAEGYYYQDASSNFKAEPNEFDDFDFSIPMEVDFNDEERHIAMGNRSSVLFFKCPHCPREFDVRKHYEKHVKECGLPNRREADVALIKSELLESESTVEPRDPEVAVFECDFCPRKFHRRHLYEKHQAECGGGGIEEVQEGDFSEDENSFEGGRWPKRRRTRNNMKYSEAEDRKEKASRGSKFSCEECGKHFAKSSLLSAHKKEHSSSKTFQCDECDAEFATRSGLTNHITTEHAEDKRFKCEECGKTFRFKSTLKRHMNEHTVQKELENDVANLEDKPVRVAPNIKYLFKEEDGKFICEHGECKNGNLAFELKSRFQHHWQEQHATEEEKIFDCRHCHEKFAATWILSRHMKNSHVLTFRCSNCEKTLDSADKLTEHLKSCTGEDAVVCGICGEDFKSSVQLLSHTRVYHNELKKHKCIECGKCFRLRSTLRKHRLNHQIMDEGHEMDPDSEFFGDDDSAMHPTPKVNYLMKESNDRVFCLHQDCIVKNVSFRWKNGFQEHWLDKHLSEEEKIYPCDYCTKKFGSFSLKNKHIKFSHVLRFKCKICEKKFATRQIFVAHMRTHTGEKPFVCEDCGLSYSQKSYLRQHRDLYHTDMKKYKCAECPMGFKSRSALRRHKMHHQVSTQVDGYKMPEEEKETPAASIKIPKVDMPMRIENGRYFCLADKCAIKGQSFQWINGLREHFMDKHAPEELKLFPCRFCGKKFGTGGLRNKHEAIFHELKFECTQCDKKFGKKSMLLDHIRTHTGEKPFVCDTCGAGFHTRGALNVHLRQRHIDPNAPKNHHCEQCGKSFHLECTLKRHLRTVHVENRPFVCEECGKNYKVHTALKRHMEFHSGITYSCEACNLTFHAQSNYKRHLRRKHLKKEGM